MSALLDFRAEVARLAGLQSIPINDDDLYLCNALTGAIQRSYGCASNHVKMVIQGQEKARIGYVWLKGTGVKALHARLGVSQ